jgi:hypothetical protein
MLEAFSKMASSLSSPVEMRLVAEYGAIFFTTATPPPTIIFADASEVEEFQQSLETAHAIIGEHRVELQRQALEALRGAAEEMRKRGGKLSARAEDSGRRSYQDTVSLWTRNVSRGIAHWLKEGRIDEERAARVKALTARDQVAVILDMENNEHIYFGTYFDKSILYSVAAPGASQHLSLLAFDVAEFESDEVEEVLGAFGWFRTVANDFPHFTFLGRKADELVSIGLKKIVRVYKEKDYYFWVPGL